MSNLFYNAHNVKTSPVELSDLYTRAGCREHRAAEGGCSKLQRCNKVLKTKKCSVGSHHSTILCVLRLTTCLINSTLNQICLFLAHCSLYCSHLPHSLSYSVFLLSLTRFFFSPFFWLCEQKSATLSCSSEVRLIAYGLLLFFCTIIPIQNDVSGYNSSNSLCNTIKEQFSYI